MPGLAGNFGCGNRITRVPRLLLLLVCLGVALNAFAQPPFQSLTIGYDQAVGLAAKWILDKQFGPARQMLAGLEKAYPNNPQVLFLEGQLAFAEGDYQTAIAIYRRMLSKDPSLTRVRLALARALFAAGDYSAARYHFEIALGQILDQQARRNIYAYLRAIQGRKSWLTFSASFGEDSNPNFATNARTVDILGSTFVLNPDARAKKSFGTVIDAQGRYAFGEDNRNFVSGALEHRNYAGSYADFDALELTLGRSWVVGQTMWTAEAGPVLADYQQKELDHGAMVRLTNARPFGERVLSTSYVSATRLQFPDYSYLTGEQYWAGTTMRYAVNPTSGAWMSVSWGRNLAHDATYSYRAVEGTLGYSKELAARLNVRLQLSANQYVYDEPSPLFGIERRDQLVQLDLVLTARDWNFHGFAPTASLSWGRNDSTIPLYSYTRQFAGLGLTRQF
ncbi:MAG TPA: surface lipoprotein assembly modifier [Burkholderiales bacterium]|nr:surface lipoprotein assembly modifier [Burkholderiales bacterium]